MHFARRDPVGARTGGCEQGFTRQTGSNLVIIKYIQRYFTTNYLIFGFSMLSVGCMAERLKRQIVERSKIVDIVAGPDAYRDLPRLLAETDSGQAAINVMLSMDETYADVMPVRMYQESKSAFV